MPEVEKINNQCPVSEDFKQCIKTYLDDLAKKDPLFEESYANKDKNLDDCCRYIFSEVKASGKQGFADMEIYGMAIHYYDESDIKIDNIGKISVVVNHDIQLSQDEIEKAKQEAYNKIVETQINSLHKKSNLTTPTIEKNIESQQQLSLF